MYFKYLLIMLLSPVSFYAAKLSLLDVFKLHTRGLEPCLLLAHTTVHL